ncbi:helix-turn-helix domain-containing protein [Streptomyces sp. NPDC020719]|uniref:IclR family transcriptional regulator n=1 Tax=Streptomyces sp. NPDC020719 TaxID=3154896 RepID=UPI0033EF95D4
MESTGVSPHAVRRPGAGAGRGVLEGAFALLEGLAGVDEAGLSYLASRAGLPKATAHRLLDQLAGLGAVERWDGRYRMGATVARLGRAWRTHRMVERAAALPLRRLAAQTRGGAAAVAPCGGDMVVIARLPGATDAAFPFVTGSVMPPGSAAAVVVAASGTATQPPAGCSTADWSRRLSAAREHGVAVHHSEGEVPMCCVVAPVHARSGAVVAAVGVTLLDGRRPGPAADAVRHAARAASVNLTRMPAAWHL